MLSYEIVRTRRKTAAIYIRRDGSVEVRAPLRMPKRDIEIFLTEKNDWIRAKSDKMLQACRQRECFSPKDGDMLTYLGHSFPIVYGKEVSFNGQVFTLTDLPFQDQRLQLIARYKALANGIIRERVGFFSVRTGLTPNGIRIGSAKTCWGSCSGQNRLNFSWKLIMAPISVIDYVVVHELAHIREHNHSKNFWKLVEDILPDYRQSRSGLKVLQEKLLRENWG